MPQYLLGIDAGTSVIKAAIFDEHGNELSRGAHNVPIVNPTTYMAEEDMDTVWVAATLAVRDAIEGSSVHASEIAAISATGQGDGTWLVDAEGEPAGPAILWTDGRAGDLIDGWYADGTISKQFQISGLGPYAGTASSLGVGVARPGDCMAVIGTAGIVTVATDDISGEIVPPDVG